jgi:hypothetical protein
MAQEIRALIPNLKHSEAAEDLHVVAVRYEKLADYLEAATAPQPV